MLMGKEIEQPDSYQVGKGLTKSHGRAELDLVSHIFYKLLDVASLNYS